MEYTRIRTLTILVQLVVLAAATALDGRGNISLQEGTKGTDPSGAYSVTAATVVSRRPSVKATGNSGKRPIRGSDKGRPSRAGGPAKPVRPDASSLPEYYVVEKNFSKDPPPIGREYAVIGVTIWRMAPAQCPIQNCPQPASNRKGLVDTATRIEDDSSLSTGERVRLALESLSHKGFVYIVNREMFADGSKGDPYLIFPTMSINNGKNWIQPGQQVTLPRAEGCFCVKSRDSKRTLVADELIVIVSPTALIDATEIGDKETLLPSSLTSFASRADNEKFYRGRLQGGDGLGQTAREQAAGSKGLVDTEPVLTQDDLPPQTVYQSLIPTGGVAVFTFSLRYN